jgi:hypothetical protein
VVEWDPQADIDVVTSDTHLFDHETYQLLTLLEAEVVQGAANSVCEARYPVTKSVLLRQHATLFNEGAALLFKGLASGVDLFGAILHFSKF